MNTELIVVVCESDAVPMVWWPSLWGSRQADSNAAYRLAPSRWDPASAITQHEAPGGSGAGAAAGLNGARRTSPISLLLSMQCRSAPLSAASEKRLTPQRRCFRLRWVRDFRASRR
jgi:hypothetical protein